MNAAPTAPVALERSDLIIDINPEWAVSWEGTRAQIEAENILPEGMEWPENFEHLRWSEGAWTFCLRRARPAGAKGARKLFLDVDWWILNRRHEDSRGWLHPAIRIKQKELAELRFMASSQGQAEFARIIEGLDVARCDPSFQQFMGAMLPPRPARAKGGAQ